MRFKLQTTQLVRYLSLTHILGALGTFSPLILGFAIGFATEGAAGIPSFSVLGGLIGIAVLIILLLIWYVRHFVRSLNYQLADNVLHIEEGVFTYQRKAIPLDRVTDIRLVQNLLMRWVGIWKIQVQTAGVGQMQAEGVLWAAESAETVRNELLAARETAVSHQRLSVVS
ncbi:MAG: PH domain-containing protein [Chloroflexota bacterium]